MSKQSLDIVDIASLSENISREGVVCLSKCGCTFFFMPAFSADSEIMRAIEFLLNLLPFEFFAGEIKR